MQSQREQAERAPRHAVFARGARTLLALALAGSAVLLTPGQARAQASYFQLDRAQISGAPEDGFMVWRPVGSAENRLYVNAALGYSHNPLRNETVTDKAEVERAIENPVQGQFITYLGGGVQLLKRLTLDASLPINLLTIYGNDPQNKGVGEGGIGDYPVAVGDLRLDVRVKTWETDGEWLKFGLGGALFAPTGNARAFAGDGSTSGMLYVASEIDLGKFFLSGNLGAHFRPEGSIGGGNGDLFLGSDLRWAFGAYLPMREGKVRLGGELWGTTGLGSVEDKNKTFAGDNTDLEWLAQGRFLIDPKSKVYLQVGAGTRLTTGYGAPDFRILGSIGTYANLTDFKAKSPARKVQIVPDADDYDRDTDGDGYPDSVDGCPTEKEDGKPPAATDGCPGNSDRDGDGIPDVDDQCPDKAEDKDKIQDEDGCPEDDADKDGIPDVQDKCPTEPGKRSAIAEKFGCPSLIEMGSDGSVQLLKPIEFETGRATIKAVSFPILDEVLDLMKSRPSMRIGIYGHTDSKGLPANNLKLSKDRAAAVRNYILGKGIAASRLESEGFGQTKPVADNNTDEGRSKNRRVEFKILSGAD
ncbi:MAG TPA: OmpA family protein [Polyangiaceae bacterium]|nr:OmpA family protein [Polyangiaceae bacterium]